MATEVTKERAKVLETIEEIDAGIRNITGPVFLSLGIGATGAARELGEAFVRCLRDIVGRSDDTVSKVLLIEKWSDTITDIMALHSASEQPDYKYMRSK